MRHVNNRILTNSRGSAAVAWVAIGISAVSFAVSFWTWKCSDDANRWSRTMAFAPALKVEHVAFDDSVRLTGDVKGWPTPDSSLHVQVSDGCYFIKFKLRNAGTAAATLVSLGSFVDTSADRVFFEWLKAGKVAGRAMPPRAVFPGDTFVDSVTSILHSAAEDKGSTFVHIVVLYQNAEGVLYDTYLWAEAHPHTIPRDSQPRIMGRRKDDSTWIMVYGRVMDVASMRYDCRLYGAGESKRLRSKIQTLPPP